MACPGCVFRFVSSIQVAKSEHVSGTSESEGIAESGLQSTSGDAGFCETSVMCCKAFLVTTKITWE